MKKPVLDEKIPPSGIGRVSRRDLIKGGVALAATVAGGVATNGGASLAFAQETRHADVIVIGAGLSGLTAAQTVLDRGKSVLVLEASDRIGGRSKTLPCPDFPKAWLDTGSSVVLPTQTRVLRLIDKLRLRTFPAYGSQPKQGKSIVYYQDEIFTYPSGTHPFNVPSPEAAQGFRSAMLELTLLAETVSATDPGLSAEASVWDKQTLDSWFDRFHLAGGLLLSPGARFLLRDTVLNFVSAEPEEMSLLHFLFFISAVVGGPFPLAGLRGIGAYAQRRRIDGGVEQLSKGYAQTLKERLLTNVQETLIDWSKPLVEVHTTRGVFTANQVIIAVPPVRAERLSYHPGVTAARDSLTQRLPMGGKIQCHVVYGEAFWRDRGYSGTVRCDPSSTLFDVNLCHDDSPDSPEGFPPKTGILTVFLLGDSARKWADRAQEPDGSPTPSFKTMVLKAIRAFFGDSPMDPSSFIVTNWQTNLHTRGGAGFSCPGALTNYHGILRAPVGPLHWAGRETATRFYSSMEGALESGERAAHEALAAL